MSNAADHLEAPAKLDDDARAEWDQLVHKITEAGKQITQADTNALEILSGLLVDIRVLHAEVRDHGFTSIGRDGGRVRNPSAVMLNQYRDAALKYMKAFRLVPVSRPIEEPANDDDLAEHLWGDTKEGAG